MVVPSASRGFLGLSDRCLWCERLIACREVCLLLTLFGISLEYGTDSLTRLSSGTFERHRDFTYNMQTCVALFHYVIVAAKRVQSSLVDNKS